MKKTEEISIDVLTHSLNPPMRVLSDSEKKKALSRYGIDDTQLPKMPENDPAARALKAKKGDLIRIERDDGTGKYVAYRIVA